MIKAIIFDYDGVIVDSFPVVHKVYLKICEEIGKKCPEDFDEFRRIYGYDSREFALNSGFSEEDIQSANIIYRKNIVKINPPLFEGIVDVLDILRQKYKIILVSASPRIDVLQKLKFYGIDFAFDKIYASDILGPMKKPQAIKKCLNDFGLNEDEIIFLGDRTIDYDEATEAGISKENILLVDYGWGYDKKKIRQNFSISKPSDILDVMEKL
jgi:phosphoglycolate phosphatase